MLTIRGVKVYSKETLVVGHALFLGYSVLVSLELKLAVYCLEQCFVGAVVAGH